MPDRSQEPKKAARLVREATELRSNLAKRKAQVRERSNAPQKQPPVVGPPEPTNAKVCKVICTDFA